MQSEFFVLPRTVLGRLIRENGGSLVVGPDRLAGLHLTITVAASSRLAATRNVGFNGQRVFVYAGRDRQFISDLGPVPDAQGLDTTLSVLRDGVVLDVLPTLVRNGEEAVVAIKSDVIPALSDIKPAAGDEAAGGWPAAGPRPRHAVLPNHGAYPRGRGGDPRGFFGPARQRERRRQ